MTDYFMLAWRKTFNRPGVDNWSPLAQFYHADEKLNAISAELDSFDARREPQRCTQLVNRLRHAQDTLLHIIGGHSARLRHVADDMLREVYPNEDDRAPRDYRVKFPDDILHDNLPGQLWFGAECLAAGSNIIDHEYESEAIRPLARALVKKLDQLREQLRVQSLKNPMQYPEKLKKTLREFDYLLSEFELK